MNKNHKQNSEKGQVEKNSVRKRANKVTAKFIKKHVSTSTHKAMDVCMSWYKQVADEYLENFKIWKYHRCKHRFCPICSYFNSRKEGFMVRMVMKYVQVILKKEFIFLTLTAPNVLKDRLKDENVKYNDSLKKMLKREPLLSVVEGYIRKAEVTYNKEPLITKEMWHGDSKEKINSMGNYFKNKGLKIGDANPNYDTYHTHFHVVIAVNSSYFKRHYVEHEEWLRLWQEAMNDDSITQVRIQRVKDTKNSSAMAEISKYMAKHSDMNISQEVFDTFYTALKGRQIITFGGVFKDACKSYKLFLKKKGNERKEDVFYQFVEKDNTNYVYEMLYHWGHNEYEEKGFKELTKEQQHELQRLFLDEDDTEEDIDV